MGYKEKQIINKILIEGSKKGRLFRANSGMAWIGEIVKKLKNSIILKNPRPFHGMPAGTADIIGWESFRLCDLILEIKSKNIKIECPRDCENCVIGKKIAIFKAVEVKTGKQKLSEDQENWKRQLLKDGGIYNEEKRDDRRKL